jgi:hypothetical protein
MESSKLYLQAKELSILLFFGGAGVIRRKLTLESLGLDIKDTVYDSRYPSLAWVFFLKGRVIQTFKVASQSKQKLSQSFLPNCWFDSQKSRRGG